MPRLTKLQREMNDERADRIQAIVDEYLSRVCDTMDDAIADMLADIRHYCDAHHLDFAGLDHRAYNNYACEKAGHE